jgi:hypothetical protein
MMAWRRASRPNALTPIAAVMRAEALSRKEGHVGAVAFSRTGNPATGDFSDAKVIKKFGDVPDDLIACEGTDKSSLKGAECGTEQSISKKEH